LFSLDPPGKIFLDIISNSLFINHPSFDATSVCATEVNPRLVMCLYAKRDTRADSRSMSWFATKCEVALSGRLNAVQTISRDGGQYF
jgi:hypothetical protein